MLLFRWLILLCLLGAAVCFAFYVGTGDLRFRRYGWVTLKWTAAGSGGIFHGIDHGARRIIAAGAYARRLDPPRS